MMNFTRNRNLKRIILMMNCLKAENHIGDTVGIIYLNSGAGFIDKRIGIITAVTVNKIIFFH